MFRFSTTTFHSVVGGMATASVLLYSSACLADVDGTQEASRDISSRGELGLALERRRAGETVSVTLVRDGKVKEVKVKLDGPG